MSKLNDFATSIESFANSEDFNVTFWFSYLGILGGIVIFLPFGLIFPPVGFAFLGLVLAPLVLYGALWAVVGAAKLLNYIDFKIQGFSVLKDSNDIDANIDVTPAATVYPQYQEGIVAYNAQGPVNAQAVQYANPISASSYESKPVEYAQLGFTVDHI